MPSCPLTFLNLTGRRRWTRSSRTGWTSRVPRKTWRWWTSGTRRYCRTTGDTCPPLTYTVRAKMMTFLDWLAVLFRIATIYWIKLTKSLDKWINDIFHNYTWHIGLTQLTSVQISHAAKLVSYLGLLMMMTFYGAFSEKGKESGHYVGSVGNKSFPIEPISMCL